MPNSLILRDRRLAGQLVARCPVITVGATTSSSSIFSRVKSAGGSSGIDTLFVLCHGFAGSNDRARVSMDAGGMGLQLGAERVLHTNVSRWEALAGTCRTIVVYACAASNTESGNEGTTADGRYLMGALAIHTRATVYAGDRIQWYNPDSMDFGHWEGQLWAFQPSGVPPTTVEAAPVELSSVL